MSQSTNFLTVKVLSSVGYNPEKIIDYRDCLVDGQQLLNIEAMKPTTDVRIMVKTL